MKFKGSGIILVILIGCILMGCSPFKGYDKADSGLFYKFYTNVDGEKPIVGQIVTIKMQYSALDSVYFDYRNFTEPLNLVINPPDFNGDLNHALMMMSPGDSASFIIKADSFFIKTLKHNRLPKGINQESVITFHVKMDRIVSKEERDKEVEAWKNQLKENEYGFIREYIQSTGKAFDSLPSGIYFHETITGDQQPPRKNDKVTLYFSITTIHGKVLYNSWEKNKPYVIKFGNTFDTEGINLALNIMKEGSRADVIVPSHLAFGAEGRGEFVPPFTPLIYDVLISDIETPEEMEAKEKAKIAENLKIEKASIEKYLSDKKLTAKPLASGLYYIEVRPGTGTAAAPGKKVSVHYTGKLLSGKQFDSSIDRGKAFDFELGKGNVIKGWDEGLCLMKSGGKAILIIPSHLGYGDKGAQPDIPPYSPLVFEIELLSVQ